MFYESTPELAEKLAGVITEDGSLVTTTHKSFEDFLALHLLLIRTFPEEAGLKPGCPRIIPELPAQQMFVSFTIAKSRTEELSRYLSELIQLDPKISHSKLVREFLQPDRDVQGLVRVDSQPQVPARRSYRLSRTPSTHSFDQSS